MSISSTYKSALIITSAVLFSTQLVVAQIKDDTGIVAKGAKVEQLGNGYAFTEGPIADHKGNVFFTDQPNNKIIKWNATDGSFEVFLETAGRSNGMFFDKKGNLIAAADEKNELWQIDKKGKHKVLLNNFEGKKLNGPNDVWVDKWGGIYFTDPLYARNYWTRDPKKEQDGEHVYYMSADRKSVKRVEEKIVKPNGIVGTADSKYLYVADIGDSKIYRYEILGPGKLGPKVAFAPMGCDGMTLDEKGNLYLAGNGVTIFNPEGTQIGHIFVRKGWTANVCFGGKDHKLLFITAGDAVFGLQMNVRGNYRK